MKHFLTIFGLMIGAGLVCLGADGMISGEVFIVTKSAENVRLGLVEVMLYDETVITNHIRWRQTLIDVERPDFESKIADLEGRITKHQADLNKLRALGTDRSTIKQFEESAELLYKKPLEDLRNEKQNWPSPQFYFKGLPKPKDSVRTRADGKFSLLTPKEGKFVLAAKASRKLYNANEEYYWLIWASLGGKDSKGIILGNHNLMGSDSEDCVVPKKIEK